VAVPGVLSAAVGASAAELGLICPASQGGEAAWAGNIEVLAAPDLLALVAHFRGSQVLTPPVIPGPRVDAPRPRLEDFPIADTAKRALEAAAIDGRALALVGPRDACSMLPASPPSRFPGWTRCRRARRRRGRGPRPPAWGNRSRWAGCS
jgi:magnesium chelatase family protein